MCQELVNVEASERRIRSPYLSNNKSKYEHTFYRFFERKPSAGNTTITICNSKYKLLRFVLIVALGTLNACPQNGASAIFTQTAFRYVMIITLEKNTCV